VNLEDQKLIQILQSAREVFLKYGVRSVNMDDISRHLGISKKTLYAYVKDKNELVQKAIHLQFEWEKNCLTEICCSGMNAIDELYEVSKFVAAQMQQLHPSVMYDLMKYHPEAIAMFREYKSQVVKTWLLDNMQRGIKEGYYRDDLNIPIISQLYMARMDNFFKEDVFPVSQFNISEVYLEVFRYHVRGIASERGLKYLIEKVKKEKQNLSGNL
jgi:hypothetical protein